MIDRVSLSRLVSQALETENRVKKKQEAQVQRTTQEGRDVVNISPQAREALRMEDQNFSDKVNKIKQDIARGKYEINVDRIMEGLKKFIA